MKDALPQSAADDDAALIERLRVRVLHAIQQDRSDRYRTVRSSSDDWAPVAPGVERKLLWVSGLAQSCLLRLAPGARVAGHLHSMDEECVVLEGSVCIGADLVLQAGDFHVAAAGSSHQDATSETGALVYLRGAVDIA